MGEHLGRLYRIMVALLGLGREPVDLQIIGAGLARTGTTSLQAALVRLLNAPVHHFENLVASPKQQAGWMTMRDQSDPELLRSLMDGHGASCDVPSALHYKALIIKNGGNRARRRS